VVAVAEGPGAVTSGDCAVCLAELEPGEKARELPRCGHRFHVECIDAWFRGDATCPLCRADAVVVNAAPSAPAKDGAPPEVRIDVAGDAAGHRSVAPPTMARLPSGTDLGKARQVFASAHFAASFCEALVAAHEMASEASSIAAAGPAPFSTCDSFVCSQFKSSSGFGFVSLDLSSDFAPHLAFRLILFLGDLEGILFDSILGKHDVQEIFMVYYYCIHHDVPQLIFFSILFVVDNPLCLLLIFLVHAPPDNFGVRPANMDLYICTGRICILCFYCC